MECTIRIQSLASHTITIKNTEIGLDELDRARQELSIPELDISLLEQEISGVHTDLDFQIIERTARESGLFKNDHHVIVKTPAGFLNDFVATKVIAERKQDTDEITTVRIIREIMGIAILDAWAEAGHPTEWGFEVAEA